MAEKSKTKEKGKDKPGWKTTEFWGSLGAELFGALTVLGITTPEVQSSIVEAIGMITGGIIMVIPAIGYIFGRSKVKSNQ